MEKSVCAIIVTYCIGKDLLQCFESIVNQVKEVIIIDNGADQETLSELNRIEKAYENVKIFYNETNHGIAAALNTGVRYAIDKGYIWILTLDHDSQATPELIETLLETYKKLNKQDVDNIAIIAANPFDTNNQEYLIDQKLFDEDSDIIETERVISSGSLINSSVFENVGFFNESLFLYYVDDDFCLRCRNKNLRIFVSRPSIIFHKEGSKEAKTLLWKKFCYHNYSPYARYYIARNTIYMLGRYLKYHRYRNSYYIVRRMFQDAMKIILFEKNKSNSIAYAIKGLFDGIAGKYGKLTDNKY